MLCTSEYSRACIGGPDCYDRGRLENGGILSLASILLFSKIKPLRGLQRHDWRNKMKIVDKNVQSEALLIFVKNMTLGIFLYLSKKYTILSGTVKPRFGLAEQIEKAEIRLRGSAQPPFYYFQKSRL